jgi:hypothetical protein
VRWGGSPVTATPIYNQDSCRVWVYVPKMPTFLHELHQCSAEVVKQEGPRYAAANLTTSRPMMGHLQGNQGSSHQTSVDESEEFPHTL